MPKLALLRHILASFFVCSFFFTAQVHAAPAPSTSACTGRLSTFSVNKRCAGGDGNTFAEASFVCEGTSDTKTIAKGTCINYLEMYKNALNTCAVTCNVTSAPPSPKPTASCRPRPGCLDSNPRCMIAETSDMCPRTSPKPTSPTPVSTPRVCSSVTGSCVTKTNTCLTYNDSCARTDFCQTPFKSCTNPTPTPTRTPAPTIKPTPACTVSCYVRNWRSASRRMCLDRCIIKNY